MEDRRFGDLHLEVRRWPLPMWPHLRREVLSAPGGSVLHEHLVRARPPRSRRRSTGGRGSGSTWWPT
ncbi:hypothetical protein [Geodermatophilus sp. SYSU D01036]